MASGGGQVRFMLFFSRWQNPTVLMVVGKVHLGQSLDVLVDICRFLGRCLLSSAFFAFRNCGTVAPGTVVD